MGPFIMATLLIPPEFLIFRMQLGGLLNTYEDVPFEYERTRSSWVSLINFYIDRDSGSWTTFQNGGRRVAPLNEHILGEPKKRQQ